MTKPPEVVDPLKAPALAALQDLKYREGSPESIAPPTLPRSQLLLALPSLLSLTSLLLLCSARAVAYKEDGNELFKLKRYREAVQVYSEAIQQHSTDDHLNAVLYSNRAAAQYHLGKEREDLQIS